MLLDGCIFILVMMWVSILDISFLGEIIE